MLVFGQRILAFGVVFEKVFCTKILRVAAILAVAAAGVVVVLGRNKPHQTVKEARKAKKQKVR